MTNEELKAIRERAEAGRSNAANEWDRCIHGAMVHECPACRGDDAKALLAEVERLRGLIKAVEWSSKSVSWRHDPPDIEAECPWCDCVPGNRHIKCPAFTESGDVR